MVRLASRPGGRNARTTISGVRPDDFAGWVGAGSGIGQGATGTSLADTKGSELSQRPR